MQAGESLPWSHYFRERWLDDQSTTQEYLPFPKEGAGVGRSRAAFVTRGHALLLPIPPLSPRPPGSLGARGVSWQADS